MLLCRHIVPLVKLLWMFGADLMAQDSQGKTPMDAAHPKMKKGLQSELLCLKCGACMRVWLRGWDTSRPLSILEVRGHVM